MAENPINPLHNIHKKYRTMNFVNHYIFTPPFVGILDSFTGASMAYSFRKLRSDYSGYCVKAKRSSDNTFLDIGFVNGVLDTATLLSFVGSGDGYVEWWYDQSGNNNILKDNTSIQRYKIVEAGILITKNGKPAMSSIHSGACVFVTTPNVSSIFDSSFCVFSLDISNGFTLIPFGYASDNDYYGLLQNGSSANGYAGYGGAIPEIYKNNNVTPNSNLRLEMAFKTGNIVLSSSFIPCSINTKRGTKYPALSSIGHIQEIIFYGVDKRSIKAGIQNNINAFYGIY